MKKGMGSLRVLGSLPASSTMKILKAFMKRRFVFAAFLIPLGIRVIPEILVGPYPVGWDTIAFYVPKTLDWAGGKASLLEIVGTDPLMYMISVPVYSLSRGNPVWIFKIMGPVLYGTMIAALFRFLQKGLKWSEKQALGGALLTSVYFVTLRIGWDLYRNMLGLTFILLSLPLLEDLKGNRQQVLLSALVVLAVASDQLTAVIALLLVSVRMTATAIRREWLDLARLARIAAPGLVLFLAVVYAYQISFSTNIIQGHAFTPSLDVFSSSLGFLVYSYLAISPLVILGMRKIPNADLRSWSVFCVGAALSTLLPFLGLVVASYRWSLLIDVPVCIYAAAGLSSLFGESHSSTWIRMPRKLILPIFSILLVSSSAFYIALPAQQALLVYTAFPPLMPTSMVQDTVPVSDMSSLRELLDLVALQIGPGTALITHQAIYGWTKAYIPSSSKYVVNYGYSSPLEGVTMARSAGFSSVLMIWWVNGSGWHGLSSVPTGFSAVFREGDMAVYSYY